MSLYPQASVLDVVLEMNGTPTTGSGPYTVFDVGGVTSALVSGKIFEANMVLQSWVGIGSVSGTALLNEQIKRFETNYAAAMVASSIIGGITVDGFNYSVGGLDVQRMGAKFQTYELFIRKKLEISKEYIQMLHDRFYVFNPSNAQGSNEYGNPITYWGVSPARY